MTGSKTAAYRWVLWLGLAVLAIPAIWPSVSVAQDGAVPDAVDAAAMDAFVEDYYLRPDPDRAIDLLAGLDVPDYLTTDEEPAASLGIAALTTFYAHVLHGSPEATLPLARRLALSDLPENVLIAALAIASAATPDAGAGLDILEASAVLPAGAFAEIRAAAPYPFPAMTARSFLDLDMFWVSFFATGDTAYIEKIADTLVHWDPDDQALIDLAASTEAPDRERLAAQVALIETVTALSARWSLARNGRTHPRVRRALSDIAGRRDDKVGDVVEDILTDLNASR
ncbi:MAG: hypothetical protein ACTS3R_01170 [Inquilinaceae bacterium]